jgi:hypothetical protein
MNCDAPEPQVARPCNFFLWGYVKDAVFAPPLPTASLQLKHWITEAMVSITREMLVQVREEPEYGTEAYHVTCEAHTECPLEFIRNFKTLFISLYAMHEHNMDTFISMIFLLFASF